MKIVSSAFVLVLLVTLLMVPMPVRADDPPTTTWRLVGITGGETCSADQDRFPTTIDVIRADQLGGEVAFTWRSARKPECFQAFRMGWAFDRDMTTITQGDVVKVTVTNELVDSNSCGMGALSNTDGGPKIRAIGANGGAAGIGRFVPEDFPSPHIYLARAPGELVFGLPQPGRPSNVVGSWVEDMRFMDTSDGEPDGSDMDSPAGVFAIRIDSGRKCHEMDYLYLAEGVDYELPPSVTPVPPQIRPTEEPGPTVTPSGVTPVPPQVVPGNDYPPPGPGTPEPVPTVRMALQAGQRRVRAGESVLVPVWLINGVNVANINFNVAYDGAVAVPEGDVLRGDLLGETLFESNTREAGLIRIGFARATGLNGTGVVALIPFRAVGRPGDRTELRLEVTTINDPGGAVLAIDRIFGLIEIIGPIEQLPENECVPDDFLDEQDAICALQMSVRLRPEDLGFDMDASGTVTSRDATIILQQLGVMLVR